MMVKTLKNEKGLLTLDFVFASMLIFGLSTVIFSFAMTLSVAEVVQYMSFAAARNYNLAHLNEDRQRERGEQKFNELVTNPIFSTMLELGWFQVEPVALDDFNDDYSPDADFADFVGARVRMSAPILYKRIPFVGSTGSDQDAFQATIQSFLAREPSFEECSTFMGQRGQQFQSRYGVFQVDQVVVTMDNGC